MQGCIKISEKRTHVRGPQSSQRFILRNQKFDRTKIPPSPTEQRQLFPMLCLSGSCLTILTALFERRHVLAILCVRVLKLETRPSGYHKTDECPLRIIGISASATPISGLNRWKCRSEASCPRKLAQPLNQRSLSPQICKSTSCGGLNYRAVFCDAHSSQSENKNCMTPATWLNGDVGHYRHAYIARIPYIPHAAVFLD